MLIEEKDIDWNCYPMGQKYGRFIWKRKVIMTNIDTGEIYQRHKWIEEPAFPLMDEDGKEKFFDIEAIPKMD